MAGPSLPLLVGERLVGGFSWQSFGSPTKPPPPTEPMQVIELMFLPSYAALFYFLICSEQRKKNAICWPAGSPGT